MAEKRKRWQDFAWKKELGDVDWEKDYDTLAEGSQYVDRTAVGIPLGGFGAGNFDYNITGTFGPWQMTPGKLERRFLSAAAFHVKEKVQDADGGDYDFNPFRAMQGTPKDVETARTLAGKSKFKESENVLMKAWNSQLLDIGSADYYALYPKGWVDYKDNFRTRLSMEFFSPVIADNYRETSLPLAYFIFKAQNPTQDTLQLSLMFTFPNLPVYRTAEKCAGIDKRAEEFEVKRYGLENVLRQEKNITGILMTSSSEKNDRQVRNSEFCIAAREDSGIKISWCRNFDGAGDGGDIWKQFAGQGRLEDFSREPEEPAGALCAEITLAPGEAKEIPFALSWYFPVTELGRAGSQEYAQWWKKYTEFYPPCPGEKDTWNPDCILSQAFAIARDGLEQLEENRRAVDAWMEPYLENEKFAGKEWVLTAGFNELYYNAFGGSFWENGLIQAAYTDYDGKSVQTETKKFGGRNYEQLPLYQESVRQYRQKEQHLHYTLEAQEFPFGETFDVRAHSHRVYTDLWPEIERDILLVYKDFIMDTQDGSCPHDAGNTNGSVFFKYDYYYDMISLLNREAYEDVIGKRHTTPWSEYAPKFILYSYEYWKATGDQGFLRDIWEAVIRSYIYQRKTDTDNDGVTNMKSSEYDRNDLFNSILWIGALEAILSWCEACPELNEKVVYTVEDTEGNVLEGVSDAICDDAKKELARCRTYVETVLWDEAKGCYLFNSDTPVLMADAFIGERHAHNAGLGNTVDPEKLAGHYLKVYEYNVGDCYSKERTGFGHCGARNLASLDTRHTYRTGDGVIEHSYDVWTGVSYVLSANMYQLGCELGREDLIRAALDTAHGVYFTTYLDTDTAYYFNTPEAWNAKNPRYSRNRMYQRARGAWELLRAVEEL